jgi:peptidoglycan DL-endopeptidase CwlO
MVKICNQCTIRVAARSEVRTGFGTGGRTGPDARTRSHHRWARVAGLGLAAAVVVAAVEEPATAATGAHRTPAIGQAVGVTDGAGAGKTPHAGTVRERAHVVARPSAVARPTAATRAKAILSFAHAQLGKPYIWGGVGPRGFDCSGLIKSAFATAGVRLPRGSIAQSGAGRRTSRLDLKPGDLVFSNNYFHVQLYIGDGRVIEAARPGTNVRISRMLPERMIDAYVRVSLS